MKVAVIHGQSHKKNTYKVTKLLLDKLNCNKDDITEFDINGFPQCCGCTQCILKDEHNCPHHEQVAQITAVVDNADVIVVESPNYCMNMTGQLKSFCDHMAFRWMSHRPVDMRNKIGVAICTTAGAGASKTTKQIAEQLIWWSVGKVYRLPFTVAAVSLEEVKQKRIDKLNKKINKIAKKVNNKAGKSKPCFKTKFYFKMMAFSHKKMPWSEIETEYWKKRGWIK